MNKNSKLFQVGLAPMDGWTDSPFRQICKEMGADFVFTEMIPAPGIIHFYKKNNDRGERPFAPTMQNFFKRLYFSEKERPIVFQIFGKRPEEMAKACQLLSQGIYGGAYCNTPVQRLVPDEININFGCPAKSAVKSGHGVALMDDPDLAADIVRRCVETQNFVSHPIPISVKMRTGWKDSSEAVPFAKKMEKAGAAKIYIHGRTFKQKYSGKADWDIIYQVAKAVDIPVYGNGDISNKEDRRKKIEDSSGLLSGVIIGRAARGNPWIFQDKLDKKIEDRSQKLAQFKAVILKHAKLMQQVKGDHGIVEFRKHLLHYISGFKNAAKYRKNLVTVTSVEQIEKALDLLSEQDLDPRSLLR